MSQDCVHLGFRCNRAILYSRLPARAVYSHEIKTVHQDVNRSVAIETPALFIELNTISTKYLEADTCQSDVNGNEMLYADSLY